MPHCEVMPYHGWQECLCVSDGNWELIATTQVGSRLLRFGFAGEGNQFWLNPDDRGKTGGDVWRIYGGHRLWHAPEHPVRTYAPDNDPIEWDWDGQRLLLRQPVEARTGIQKEVEIRPAEHAVEIVHRLVNRNLWTVRLAAWALSVMAPGGVALIPQEPYQPHPDALLPVRVIALWAYTDMSDPRLCWGKRLIQVRQSPTVSHPLKIGMSNTLGWIAYWHGETLFVKRYRHARSAVYPDGGCNTEIFTNAAMLELETLSPLTELPPGEALEHTEWWSLHRVGAMPAEEAAIIEALARCSVAPLP
ncbi:MAG: hypothetical protein KatS3mg016_0440 [Fimbriimonadales bacterium]|nr:MAG: hypothetical protein KatS3mg016_0440 [Fimbriimonadales bacterium]